MEKLIEKYNNYGCDRPEDERALYHMNCSEVLLRAVNEAYDLSIPEESYKLLQGFGGGFHSEKACGAFSGALAGLGALYSKERPTDQKQIKQAAKFLVEEFEKEFGSLDCDKIKAKYRDPVLACNPVKVRAGEVFNRVVARMENEGELHEN